MVIFSSRIRFKWMLSSLFVTIGVGLFVLHSFVNAAQPNPCVFTDVCDKSAPGYEAVRVLKSQGIIKGNPDGSFQGSKQLNRAEVLALLFRSMNITPAFSADQTFKDVPQKAWFASVVSEAKKRSVVGGYPDKTFRAGNVVKVEEAAKMFMKAMELPLPVLSKGYRSEDSLQEEASGVPFDQWFTSYMKVVHDYKLVDSIAPGNELTREQVALLLYRLSLAKEDIKMKNTYLTTWYGDNASIHNGGGYPVFLQKAIDLSKASSFIQLTDSQGKQYPITTKNYTWSGERYTSWGSQEIGQLLLKNYTYRPTEVVIKPTTPSKDDTNFTLTLKKGLPDIYGTVLTEDKVLHFKMLGEGKTVHLALSGSSYSLDTEKPTIQVKGEGIQTYTVWLCSVPETTWMTEMRSDVVGGEDENIPREYFWVKDGEKLEDQLRQKCTSLEKKDYDGKDLNNKAKNISLQDIQPSFTPGIYYVALTSPQLDMTSLRDQQNNLIHRFMYVANGVLTMKQSKKGEIFFWLSDRKGQGIGGKKITLYDVGVGNINWDTLDKEKNTYKEVATFTTDASGMVKNMPFAYSEAENLFAIVHQDNTFAVTGSNWRDGIEPYRFNIDEGWVGEIEKTHQVFMTTDRKIYRPGHTVEMKGVLRKYADNGFTLPTAKQVEVSIQDSQSKEVYRKVQDVSEYGTFSGAFQIPESAMVGSYSILLSTADPAQDIGFSGAAFGSFQVEEYRKPDVRITVAGLKTNYIQGEVMNADINAEYYFGGAVNGGSVHWTLERDLLWSPVVNSDMWFNFTNWMLCYFDCGTSSTTVATGDVELDAKGNVHVSSPLSLDDLPSGGVYTLEITVTDVNRKEVTKREEFRVHKANGYAGIVAAQYVTQLKNPLTFNVRTVTIDGKRNPNQKVQVRLLTQDWASYTKEGLASNEAVTNEVKENQVDAKEVTTNNEGDASVAFQVTTPGTYVGEVLFLDSAGKKNVAREYAYVSSDAGSYVSWAANDGFKMPLVLDKKEYQVGDQAHILVQSPFEKGRALVTVERETVLDTYVVDLPTNASTITLPIKESYLPNVFVNVLLLSTTDTPGFRVGYKQIQVDATSKKIQIDLSTDKKIYQPREEVTLTISSKNSSGQPIPAEISIAVVDESVIALAGGVDRDIFNAFYALRMLGVVTSHSMTHFLEKAMLETVGGGGAKGGISGLPLMRGNMLDTAFWNAHVTTDASGNAQVKFTLPDNLTHWEILAIGTTKDTKVGSSAMSIESKQDFVIAPGLPRFVRQRDTVELSYSLMNMTDNDEVVTAHLDAKNIPDRLDDKTVTVPKNSSAKVSWIVKIPDMLQSLDLQMTAKGPKLGDALSVSLPVKAFQLPEENQQTIILNTQKSMTLTLPSADKMITSTGKVIVRVSPSILGGLKSSLFYLLQYPYGCAEQTTSTMRPNIILAKMLRLTGVELFGVSKKQIDSNVNAALSKLYGYQADDGGWALWGGNTGEDPYLTSYVVSSLLDAKENGFAVDTNVLSKGLDYLQNTLNSSGSIEAGLQVQLVNTLMQGGRSAGMNAHAERLFAARGKMDMLGSIALLRLYTHPSLTIATKGERQKLLLSEIKSKMSGSQFKESNPYGYSYFGASQQRLLAEYLEVLVKAGLEKDLYPQYLQTLMSRMNTDQYAITHETSYVVKAIAAYVEIQKQWSKANTTVVVHVGNKTENIIFTQGVLSDPKVMEYAMSEFTSPTITVTATSDAPQAIVQGGTSYIPVSQTQMSSQAPFEVLRTVEKVDTQGNKSPFNGVLSFGDNLHVTLTLKMKPNQTAKRVALEDFLPAGIEAINTTLKTERSGSSESDEWLDHIEVRDDRVFIYVESGRTYTYEYDARVIEKGTYSWPSVRGYEMYAPEHTSKSESKIIQIK